MKCFLSVFVLLASIQATASAVFVELQLNTISTVGTQRATVEIDNGVLQPFDVAFGSSSLSFIATSPSYTVFGDPIGFSLDTATPLADLTPSSFELTNMTGTWAANITTNGLKDIVGGSYNLPLEITSVMVDSNQFLVTSRAVGNQRIADTTIQGQPFIIESGGQSITNASPVPEPSQYLMFGIIAASCLGWRKWKKPKPTN